ncbi:MAG TPA: EVE domain-containing protein [Opitutales bacterium]|nr:EVE domain-containing protein [Opitutales bacterium]
MNYWLVKQEPEDYSWDDLVRDGKTVWDGVRNYQARNNLKNMKVGDRVFFYHSVKERRIVGIAEVVREAFPDPTIDDDRWVAVELKAVEPIANPVSLDQIKKDASLAEIPLVRQSRLSVMPLEKEVFDRILELAQHR